MSGFIINVPKRISVDDSVVFFFAITDLLHRSIADRHNQVIVDDTR